MPNEYKRLLVYKRHHSKLKHFAEVEKRNLIDQFAIVLAFYEATKPELWDSRDRQNIRRMLLEGEKD